MAVHLETFQSPAFESFFFSFWNTFKENDDE